MLYLYVKYLKTIMTKYINIQKIFGSISGVVVERIAYINDLIVYDSFRNQGYGIYLIKEFCDKSTEKGGIRIELDDMSDNSRKEHNIYIKVGFRYKYKYGPEMFGNIRNIKLKLSRI